VETSRHPSERQGDAFGLRSKRGKGCHGFERL